MALPPPLRPITYKGVLGSIVNGPCATHARTILQQPSHEANLLVFGSGQADAPARLVRPPAFGYGRQLSWRAKGAEMAFGRNRRGGIGGISLGGVLVIVGIVVALAWSLLLGIIIAVIGLVAFGGFVRGKWY